MTSRTKEGREARAHAQVSFCFKDLGETLSSLLHSPPFLPPRRSERFALAYISWSSSTVLDHPQGMIPFSCHSRYLRQSLEWLWERGLLLQAGPGNSEAISLSLVKLD